MCFTDLLNAPELGIFFCTASFTKEFVTVLSMEDDVEGVSSLSSLGNEIFRELFKVSPQISSGLWEFSGW